MLDDVAGHVPDGTCPHAFKIGKEARETRGLLDVEVRNLQKEEDEDGTVDQVYPKIY